MLRFTTIRSFAKMWAHVHPEQRWTTLLPHQNILKSKINSKKSDECISMAIHATNIKEFHTLRQGPRVEISKEGEKYTIVQELKELDSLFMTDIVALDEEMSFTIFDCKTTDEITEFMKAWTKVRNSHYLFLLRKILFLRFRVTVREVMEPLLTEKVVPIEEEVCANFIANVANPNREVGYSFFLKQLDKDIESGHLDSFFREHYFSRVEFGKICKLAIEVDREVFFISRPLDVYYVQEEVSSVIKFPKVFHSDEIYEIIRRMRVSDDLEHKLRRINYHLIKLVKVKAATSASLDVK